MILYVKKDREILHMIIRDREMAGSGNAISNKSSPVAVFSVTAAAVCALLLALTLAAACPAPARGGVEFLYEETLDLAGDLTRTLRPSAVTCDPLTGEVCVTDERQGAFLVFNSFGILTFQTGVLAGLSFPADGTLDEQGGIVFVDHAGTGGSTIKRLDLYGEPVDFQSEGINVNWDPRHLILTHDGHAVTLDPFLGLLAKHDGQTGRLLWSAHLGDVTSDALHLGRPVEGPDARIVIPGGELHRVLIVGEGGQVEDSFGRYGTSPGRMIFPVGAAFLPDGSLVVLDRMRHKLMVFDAAHEFLGEYGALGSGRGQFYHPSAVASDAQGRVFVAQGYQGRVQVFRIATS